ncbi:hypothetical protein UPYG_G00278450 [Umbra pygmaea]|uniref:Uncharacterized protein n=1 Tax=Umbra pygmaea TaxID=75934 RepID=A0ABD0WKL0_UMBPY
MEMRGRKKNNYREKDTTKYVGAPRAGMQQIQRSASPAFLHHCSPPSPVHYASSGERTTPGSSIIHHGCVLYMKGFHLFTSCEELFP